MADPSLAETLSPTSSAGKESRWQHSETLDDTAKTSTRKDESMAQIADEASGPPDLGMDDDRERMIQQFQDMLNSDEKEKSYSAHAGDVRCGQTANLFQDNTVSHRSEVQQSRGIGDYAEDGLGEANKMGDSTEACWMEVSEREGSGFDASVQNDGTLAWNCSQTCSRKFEYSDQVDESVKGMPSQMSVDVAVVMATDIATDDGRITDSYMDNSKITDDTDGITDTMDGSEIMGHTDSSETTHCQTSSVTAPPLNGAAAAAAGSVAQPDSSEACPVPDIISTHDLDQTAPPNPDMSFCMSAESRNWMQCCASSEDGDCPKRSAAIFTELVADVGGCLCSKGDLRDRLPRGWPDIFYPLPDLIASQRSFESQNPTSREMTLGKTILVTGGAGYVGSHAVIELVQANYNIVVVDNLVNASMESIRRVEKIVGKSIKSYSVDLLNKPALDEVFTKHTVHAVIHFAGLKAVGESCEMPLLYYKNNVGGTTNLLEVMEAHGVYNLVFSSSATVYGTPQFLPLTEQHPVGGCTNPYGKTKYMVEQMLCDIAASNENWNFIILRYFNPVGAHKSGTIGEDPAGVPNNLMPFIGQVAVGRRAALKVYGSDYDTHDGTGVRDYIHVVDLAKGHLAALRKLDEQCGLKIYNLGTGQGYTVLDMVKAFEKASGKHIPYELAPRRLGDVPAMYSDPSRAAKELGWAVEKGLDEMCTDLWRWQSNNPHGYNVNSKE